MLRLFTRPIDSLTKADIEEVCAEEVPESDQVEFKVDLPTKNNRDKWYNGTNQIGDRARDHLLARIIAFANAYGGHLVLGIQETTDKPARAESVVPLPRCCELAEKLRLQARDCIEPQLPVLETFGVETDDKKNGVVVVRVQKSRLAPHRINSQSSKRDCYIRRADRTERMTMREIQDLTLNLQQGRERIEDRFRELHMKCKGRMSSDAIGPDGGPVGLQVVAVPLLADIHIDPRELAPWWPQTEFQVKPGQPFASAFDFVLRPEPRPPISLHPQDLLVGQGIF